MNANLALAKSQEDPQITQDSGVWRALFESQAKLLPGRVCDQYQLGLKSMGLDAGKIPELKGLSARMQERTGWRMMPVHGMIAPSLFFELLAGGRFPVVRRLRAEAGHLSTPDPDFWHDVYGHLPFLHDPLFSRIYRMFGQIGTQAFSLGDWAVEAVSRIYWYTIEFGLIETRQGLRAYGAGLIPSPEELLFALSDQTSKRAMRVAELARKDYQAGSLQHELYVIRSFESLEHELKEWASSVNLL
jgi:phenylalanine-4-hydroxylase